MVAENGPIIWTNEKRKLRDLVPWEHNPREIHEKEAERLGESLELFGQIQTLAIGPDGELYDGHQRRYVWSVLPRFGPDYEVDVRVSSRPLTERERQQLVVYLHRGTIAEWNWEELANSFELDDLLDWGFSQDELTGLGSDGDDIYSQKVTAPIYTPRGAKPPIGDLVDTARAEMLVKAIEGADIPEDEREFLRLAAQRHMVFNFHKIAEYYAQSDAEIQRLMEDSGLVIIDFDRAIELGFVQLSDLFAHQYGEDYQS